MFVVIYNLNTREIISITNKGDLERVKEVLLPEQGFIVVDTIPFVKQYRQKLMVSDKEELVVVDVELNDDELKWVIELETRQELNSLLQFLESTDYKVLKYIDGEYTDEEYAAIKLERKQARERIRELELTIK